MAVSYTQLSLGEEEHRETRGRESRSMATTAGVRLAAETLYKEVWDGLGESCDGAISKLLRWSFVIIFLSFSDVIPNCSIYILIYIYIYYSYILR